ncbi:hypothetical protein BJ165DRAFT_967855 [Panaeolus papilionaceus]|nr:hypothetical protein BJ165DRAFT_967855 [Panaeolus papilionaceus]
MHTPVSSFSKERTMFSHITTTNPFLLNIPNNTTVHLTTSKTRMLCTSVYQLPSRVLPIISLYKCSHHDQRGTAKNSPVERTACKNIARRETTHNRKHVEQQSTTSTEDHRLRFRVLESLKTLKSSCACQEAMMMPTATTYGMSLTESSVIGWSLSRPPKVGAASVARIKFGSVNIPYSGITHDAIVLLNGLNSPPKGSSRFRKY